MLLVLRGGGDAEDTGHSTTSAQAERWEDDIGREDTPVNGALDITTSQERECVGCVDSESRILRFDPFPFSGLVILDLERSNRLAE